jgi:hypothetical protein
MFTQSENDLSNLNTRRPRTLDSPEKRGQKIHPSSGVKENPFSACLHMAANDLHRPQSLRVLAGGEKDSETDINFDTPGKHALQTTRRDQAAKEICTRVEA